MLMCTSFNVKEKQPLPTPKIKRQAVYTDKCDSTLFPLFDYPDIIEQLRKKYYICDSLLFKQEQDSLYPVWGRLIFEDKKFRLIYTSERSLILKDKQRKLNYFFRRGDTHQDFTHASIVVIYRLNERYMPLYDIRAEIPYIYINGKRKRSVDNMSTTHYSKSIYTKKSLCYTKIWFTNPTIELNMYKFKYADLLKIDEEYKKGNYIVSDTVDSQLGDDFISKLPMWVTDL